MTILVFDTIKNQERSFQVVPEDPNFVPMCKANLHQGHTYHRFCACGKFRLTGISGRNFASGDK